MKRTTWRKLLPVRRLAGETSGAEIAEAAVVLPLLFMLLFGIMWFARAFNIYTTINRAARQGALAAATHKCATCGNTLADLAYVQSVVNPILTASHLDPAQVQNFTVLWNQPLNPATPPIEYGTIVSLQYPYSFKLNGMSCCPPTLTPITTGIIMTAQATARQEE